MGRRYANPPIQEMICLFLLGERTPWDITIPGLLYEHLKAEFPRKQHQPAQEVNVRPIPEGFVQEFRRREQIWLFAETGNAIVQISTRMVSFHALRPYPSWEAIRPKIYLLWNSLQRALPAIEIEYLGLRYVNRISLPSEDWGLYLTYYPFWGQTFPSNRVGFAMSTLLAYHEQRDACRVQTLADMRRKTGSIELVLDIEYFLAKPQGIPPHETLAWLDNAHEQVSVIFEGCLTDNLRKTFGEVV